MSNPSELMPVSGPLLPSRTAQPTAPVQTVAVTRKPAPFGKAPDRFQARAQHHELDRPDRDPVPRADRRASNPHLEAAIVGRPSGASAGFMAQVLNQAWGSGRAAGLPGHRDGAVLGSNAYRRAGGEPALYSTGATLFRLTA